jgi:predicted phage terminase large subunit-like protein
MMVASYNEKLSRQLSKVVRGSIMEVKADSDIPVFSDVFPEVKMKAGAGQVDLWQLAQAPTSTYLSTSPGGTATGMGAHFLIIDDIIKNAYEAFHAGILASHFTWFTDTMVQRLEGKRKLVLVMTRWATKDLAGRICSLYAEQGRKIRIFTKKAWDGNAMLNPKMLNKPDYDKLMMTIGEDIFKANYDQEPVDIKGRLYGEFVTYTEKPAFAKIKAYCDVADKGSDYLANGIYGVTGGHDPEAYMLDVLYSQESMDKVESDLAKRLIDFGVDEFLCENNFGGRAWVKVIEAKYKELGGQKCKFKTFHQERNKEAKILATSSTVTRKILMPDLWYQRWSKFHTDVTEYQRTGNNLHDDAQDMLSEICIRLGKSGITIMGARDK